MVIDPLSSGGANLGREVEACAAAHRLSIRFRPVYSFEIALAKSSSKSSASMPAENLVVPSVIPTSARAWYDRLLWVAVVGCVIKLLASQNCW